MDFWNLASHEPAHVVIERRNEERLNLFEYVALTTQEELNLEAVYERCDRTEFIRLMAMSIYRLLSYNYTSVNYQILLDQLTEQDLLVMAGFSLEAEGPSRHSETLLSKMLSLQGADIKKAEIVVEIFKRLSDTNHIQFMITSHFKNVEHVMNNSVLLDYVIKTLQPAEFKTILLVNTGRHSTSLRGLIQSNFDICCLFKRFEFNTIHSLIENEYEDDNLLELAQPDNYKAIVSLYMDHQDKLLQLCLNRYNRYTPTERCGVRDSLTLFLIHQTPNPTQEMLTIKHMLLKQFGIKEKALLEQPTALAVTETDISIKAVLWLCSLLYPKAKNIEELLHKTFTDKSNGSALLVLSALVQLDERILFKHTESSQQLENAIKANREFLIENKQQWFQMLINWINWESACSIQYFLESMSDDQFQLLKTESDEKGQNLLQISIQNDRPKVFKTLLEFLQKKNILSDIIAMVDDTGYSSLHTAAQQTNTLFFDTLLSSFEDKTRFSQIHGLLSAGGGPLSRTVLHTAIENGQQQVFSLIILFYRDWPDQFLQLVSTKDKNQSSLFLSAVEQHGGLYITTILNVLDESRYFNNIHELLCSETEARLPLKLPFTTAITNMSPCFEAILHYYEKRKEKFLALLALTDGQGFTAFHTAARIKTNFYLNSLLKTFKPIICFQRVHDMMCSTGKGRNQNMTVLQTTISHGNSGAFTAILEFYQKHIDDFIELLSVQNIHNRETALHAAAQHKDVFYLDTILSLCSSHNHYIMLHSVFTSTNKTGLTPLFSAIQKKCHSNIVAIASFYGKESMDHSFKELVSTESLINVTKSSQSGNVDVETVCEIMDCYYRVKSEAEMTEVLVNCVSHLDCSNLTFTVKYILISLCELIKSNPTNFQILSNFIEKEGAIFEPSVHRLFQCVKDWYSSTNEAHRMSSIPAILIIYNTKNRPGAEKEAETLIEAFSTNGLPVVPKQDLSKPQIIDEIGKIQDTTESKSALIVVMMSHGVQGSIYDNDGQRIEITEIERAMCASSHSGVPKVLILQCCQGPGQHWWRDVIAQELFDPGRPASSAASSIKAPKALPPYSLKSDEFLVIMSTVAGEPSNRNHFIPLLAEVIKSCSLEENLIDIFQKVQTKMKASDKTQTSLLQMTLNLKLNIFGSFQSLLSQMIRSEGGYILHRTPSILSCGVPREDLMFRKELTTRMIWQDELFHKNELLKAIEENKLSEEGRNGQVVILIGRGDSTHVHGWDGTPLPFKEIEQIMCKNSQPNTPKVLIVHTCDDLLALCSSKACDNCDANSAAIESGTSMHYKPESEDFCSVISGVSGDVSAEIYFMDTLKMKLKDMPPNLDLVDLFDSSFDSLLQERAAEKNYTHRGLRIESNLKRKLFLKSTKVSVKDFSQNVTAAELECDITRINKRRCSI